MAIWKITTHHDQPEDAFSAWRSRGLVAVGWTNIGDLTKLSPRSSSEIGAYIRAEYPNLPNSGTGGPSLWNFYSNVRVGDHVIAVSKGKRLGVMLVTGEYFHAREDDGVLGYGHIRRAEFTAIDAELLWHSVQTVALGQSIQWTVGLCRQSSDAEDRLYEEGQRYSVISTAVERNPAARQACVDRFGPMCISCGFDFKKVFGDAGSGLIHVHHLTELSSRSGPHSVNPITDLVPLCPNCHAMAHRRRPPYTPGELKTLRDSLGIAAKDQ